MDLNQFLSGYTPEENKSYDPIPEGEYGAIVDAIEIKDDGKGSYAKVTYKIIGPTHANRLVWDRCFLTHSNPKANEVGKGKLHRLATCIGIPPATSSKDDYIGCKVTIALEISGEFNNVKRIAKYEGAQTAAPVAKPVVTPSAKPVQEDEGGAW